MMWRKNALKLKATSVIPFSKILFEKNVLALFSQHHIYSIQLTFPKISLPLPILRISSF